MRDGAPVGLPSRSASVLGVLLANPGEVLSRAELIAAAWPDLHVTESSVSEAISQLRQALGDDAHQPRWIQTVPRRGYRFCGELDSGVEAVEAEGHREIEAPRPSASVSLDSDSGRRWLRGAAGWLGAAALGVVAVVGMRVEPDSVAPERSEFSIPFPENTSFETLEPALALAPDASELTLTLLRDGASSLWRRARDRVGVEPIDGTSGARSPSYHPDGRLYFLRGDRVERLEPGGSVATQVIEAPGATTLSLTPEGSLLLTHARSTRLSRSVPPYEAWERLAEIDPNAGELRLLQPSSPESGKVRFLRWRGSFERSAWTELDLATRRETAMGPALANARWVGDRWLWTRDGQIQAGHTAGVADAVVAASTFVDRRLAQAQIDIAGHDLVHLAAEGASHLELVVTDSDLRPLRALASGSYLGFRATASGERLALVLQQGGARELWTVHVASGTERRHTYGSTVDGVAFLSESEILFTERGGAFRRLELTTGQVEDWFQVPGGRPGARLTDGTLLFSAPDAEGRLRLGTARPSEEQGWILERNLPTSCPGESLRPAASPDGRHLAFLCRGSEGAQLFMIRLGGELDGTQAVQVTRESPGFVHFDWFGRDAVWLATRDGHTMIAELADLGEHPEPSLVVRRRFHIGAWVLALPRPDGTFLAARLGSAEGGQPAIHWIRGWKQAASDR